MQIHTIPVSLTFMEEPSYIQCVILDGGEYSSADGQELQGVSKGWFIGSYAIEKGWVCLIVTPWCALPRERDDLLLFILQMEHTELKHATACLPPTPLWH